MPTDLTTFDRNVCLWRKLLAPVVFAFACVHYFQILIRGGSTVLEFFLIASIAVAIWSTSLLHRLFEVRVSQMLGIVGTAIISAVFFALWALTSVVAEEIYIYTWIDAEEGRRIYTDDSGEGYAVGLKGMPVCTLLFMGFGLIFGFIWGSLLWILQKLLAKAKPKPEP